MNRTRTDEGCSEQRPLGTWWTRAVLVGGCLVALLAGCQTPPAPNAKQMEALRSLGFNETDDGWTLNLAEPILFDVDSDELKPEPRRAIGEMAKELRQIGIARIRIEGHTDKMGSRGYNVELSRRRAEVVAREFLAYGFPDTSIERKAWGFEHPVASNDTPEGRALNRRVAIVVVAADPM